MSLTEKFIIYDEYVIISENCWSIGCWFEIISKVNKSHEMLFIIFWLSAVKIFNLYVCFGKSAESKIFFNVITVWCYPYNYNSSFLAESLKLYITSIVRFFFLSDFQFSQVNVDEPMFQPFPSEIFFQKFEPFETYEVPLVLRNNDKVCINFGFEF